MAMMWVNNAAKYIFSMEENDKLDIPLKRRILIRQKFYADSFDVFLKLLREKKKFSENNI